ncbi:MAG: hypothetical protein WBM41_08255 [Arenicellales bacterium]
MRLPVSKKWSDQVMSGLVVMALFIPMLVMLSGHEAEISGREKRRLAAKPILELRALWSGDYQREYNNYFRDHFGLRDEILNAARWFRESLFNKSISDRVIIGREGWRYYSIDGSLRDFIGEYHPTRKQLQRWEQALRLKQLWLGSLGVRYLLVPIPGKMSVYSEYLPDRVRKVAGTTRLQAFREYLSALPENEFVVDAYRVLLDSKTQGPMFFRTDTHWNDHGAYQVYAAVMQDLGKWFPDLAPLPLSQFARKVKNKKGDIAQASSVPIDLTEPAEALYLLEPCSGSEYRVLESFAQTQAYREIPKRLPEVNGCPSKQHKAIVIHDSFGQFLKQFLNESFNEVVYMPSYDLFGMKSFIEEYQPDVIIDFRVDRRFHLLLEPDPRMAAELGLGQE